jgi:hypothetical protein
MPKFRVKIEKPINGRGHNPFKPVNINQRIKASIRVFEFEAKDEDEVKKYFYEAKAADLPNVRGYKLRSIERIEV